VILSEQLISDTNVTYIVCAGERFNGDLGILTPGHILAIFQQHFVQNHSSCIAFYNTKSNLFLSAYRRSKIITIFIRIAINIAKFHTFFPAIFIL
jgi:hypothetical protein